MATGPKVGGGPPQIPKPYSDADGFADDKVGAEKAKKSQNKESAKEASKKSRSAELAKQAQKVQKAMLQDGHDHGPAKKAVRDQGPQGPRIKEGEGQKGGAQTSDQIMNRAGKELGSLSKLVSALSAAIADASDVIESSFVDDKLAAQKASQKGAKERNKQASDKNRLQQEQNKQAKKVASSAGASGDSEQGDKAQASTKTQKTDQKLGQEDAASKEFLGKKLGSGGQTLKEMVRSVQEQAARLLTLGTQVGQQANAEAQASQLREMAAMLLQAHQKLKELLLPMLLGELGSLKKNRYLQFKRLFESTESWPTTVPPGRNCKNPADWSDEEWDAFLSWFFTPPELPPELLEGP